MDYNELKMKANRKQRTLTQNAALHVWYEQCAQTFNDAGLDMRKVLKEEIEIPWTKESVKNHLWKPVQELMLDKKSTTELNTVDPSEIYEVLNRYFSEKFGIFIPWPSNEPTEN